MFHLCKHCIPHSTLCADYALAMFWTLAVFLGDNALQAAVLLCRKCTWTPAVPVIMPTNSPG
jgi:hypothetical protein